MRKPLVPCLMLLSLLLAACNASAPAVSDGQDDAGIDAGDVSDEAQTEEPADDGTVDQESGDDADGDDAEAAVRVIDINAKNWEFSPAEIRVKKGEKVTLRLTGEEGTHGFAVPDLGVNVSVSASQKVSVDLPSGTAGEFSFRCSIPCGPGHKDMIGKIIIEE